MEILFFCVSLIASTIGAISGIGGGVIIKPVLDSLQVMSVSEISFLSGCTVLTMAVVSLLRGRGGNVKVDVRISGWLAAGACVGGVLGQSAFAALQQALQNQKIVGVTQSVLLLLINVGVFLYLRYKNRITTKQLHHPVVCLAIGLSLGMISSFLGIGGGPINIAVLSYLFSMQAKETALNSLFIIFFSQITSLGSTMLGGRIPAVAPLALALMCLGGVLGATLGRSISNRVSDRMVERIFTVVLLLLMLLNIYNIVLYAV